MYTPQRKHLLELDSSALDEVKRYGQHTGLSLTSAFQRAASVLHRSSTYLPSFGPAPPIMSHAFR